MAAQPLRRAATRLLLNCFEHPAEIARVVAAARHDLRAQQVCLLLVLPAVFEQPRTEAELAAFGDHLPPPSAHDGSGDCSSELAELKALGLGGVRSPVPQQHVA